ncbi:MAG: hypothetical protein CMF59_08185 [Leptospiraceae bacterium]|nr:hypothetical protein [Leptospiraceae bacterium]
MEAPDQTPALHSLHQAVLPQLDEKGRSWLKECLEENLGGTLDRRMAAARRKVGDRPFSMDFPWTEQTTQIMAERGLSGLLIGHSFWSCAGWDISDAVRILLVLKGSGGQSSVIKESFRRGDEKERCAILKGMLLLDPAGSLVELFIDAGRTNSVEMFSAIAMGNPYPAIFYDEPQFNQLVLKALFLDLNAGHIFGLKQRTGPSLIQMCEDFRQERKAAGRSVPESLKQILS